MTERIKLHPITPHRKRIFEIADALRQKSVLLFPTDSQYALGCEISNKKGIKRIRQIRHLGKQHHFTLILNSLSGVSRFAYLNDENFKLIKQLMPGPYTFILPATKEVPNLLVHPKKKTSGIRIPKYEICQQIIDVLDAPLLAVTAKKPELEDEELFGLEREGFLSQFDKQVDITIDDQQEMNHLETTVIDLTDEKPIVIREGLGMENITITESREELFQE